MRFEWDDAKEKKNIIKHGIDFETAARIFADPYRIEYLDIKHSVNEERYITIGEIHDKLFVITVVYTEREDSIRIISARKATLKEREAYYGST